MQPGPASSSMQPLQIRPQLQQLPARPKIFYSNTIGRSTLRVILIHKTLPLYLGGAFQFQCLAGRVFTMGFNFDGADFNESALTPVCVPSSTHNPIIFNVPTNLVSLLAGGGEEILQKRLAALDIKFGPVKEAITALGYSAAIVVTEPHTKIKNIESITGWQIFKPLPEFEPHEVSKYCYITKNSREIVSSQNSPCIEKFGITLLKNWEACKQTIGMICGPKGSGKSTMSKYISNLLLASKSNETYTLYYMDCDVGQSEFTPPGLLSIMKVEKPFLSAAFASQIRTFHNSYYYGAVTPEIDIDLYKAILMQCFTDFFQITSDDPHALLVINTLGWVEDFGYELLNYIVTIFSPCCVLSLTNHRSKYTPPNYFNPVIYQQGYVIPMDRKISSPKLRALAMTGYFTQCFLKSMNLDVASFSEVPVRMVSFSNIGIFIHPSNLVSDRCYLAALNMSTVALCKIPEQFTDAYKREKLCGKPNMPYKIESANRETKPFFKCVGYGLVRAISIEKEKIYIITPVESEFLEGVNVLALGNDIHTPHWIFQSQNTSHAPYLMHTGRRSNTNDFGRLSMPLKIIGAHKRNHFLQNRAR